MAGIDVTTYPTRRYQHVDWDSERWVGFDYARAIFMFVPAISQAQLGPK